MIAVSNTPSFGLAATLAMMPLAPGEALPEPATPGGPSPYREIDGNRVLRAVKPTEANPRRALILHGGGDAPGMNATLLGFAITLRNAGWEPWGVLHGWSGLTDPNGLFVPITPQLAHQYYRDGGTILGTGHRGRSPFDKILGIDDPMKTAAEHLRLFEGRLFVVGGNGSGWVAEHLFAAGLKVLFTPGTIDNDIPFMQSIGFASAAKEGADDVEKLATTGSSCVNVMVTEIMGARRGALPLAVGIAGGADYVIIPEVLADLENGLIPRIAEALKRGRAFTIVVGEGADFTYRSKNFLTSEKKRKAPSDRKIGESLADILKTQFDVPAKFVAPRYLLRGVHPLPEDILRGIAAGRQAAHLMIAGHHGKVIPPDSIPHHPYALRDFFTRNPADRRLTQSLRNDWKMLYG